MKIIQQLPTILYVILQATLLQGQSKSDIRPLDIGDKVPDIEIENVINYSKNRFDLNEFGDKNIILDFWGPSCLDCLRSFSKLDSLQKEFSNELQIIMVNIESSDSTTRFFKKKKKLQQPAIPFATTDILLNQLFPHTGVPFVVWIDKNRAIRYITNGKYVGKENIEKFIAGRTLSLPRAAEHIYTQTLFDDKWSNRIQTYSYIAKCDGLLHAIGSADAKRKQVIATGCVSISRLYQIAIDGVTNSRYELYRPGRIIVETKDSIRHFKPTNQSFKEWRELYAYDYQSYCNIEDTSRRYIKMKNELDGYFGIEASIEKRPVKCLTLVRTSEEDKLVSKGGKPADNFYTTGLRAIKIDSIRYIRNKPFHEFSSRLGGLIEYNYKKPFADMAGYTGNIDILFNGKTLDEFDPDEIKRELKKYNLDLVEREIFMDVLVLKDIK